MSKTLMFPIFSLEIETGEIRMCVDVNDLRLFVEEFWDIIRDDFKLWDKDGYPIEFNRTFLDGDDSGFTRTKRNEMNIIRNHLINYAAGKNKAITDISSDLKDIFNELNE